MRFIDPTTLDPPDGGTAYVDYLRGVWPSLPSGVVALVEAVFHDGWLTLVGEEPAAGVLRFTLRNYVGDGWGVYDIVYAGVTAVERIDPWPGAVIEIAPPYRRWFTFEDGDEDGIGVHRDELFRESGGLFEHRLMTTGRAVRIIRFRDAEVTFRRE